MNHSNASVLIVSINYRGVIEYTGKRSVQNKSTTTVVWLENNNNNSLKRHAMQKINQKTSNMPHDYLIKNDHRYV